MVKVIVVDPAVPPVTTPVVEPTEAVDGARLLHIPPVLVSVKVTVASEQTAAGPDITPGNAFTVITVVAEQPDTEEVKIIESEPGLIPVTRPDDGSTVATVVNWLVHIPVPLEVLKGSVASTHTGAAPVIGDGSASTVIGKLTEQPPIAV